MPFFKNDTFLMQRELRQLRDENEGLKAERAVLDRALNESQRELAEAKSAQPASLAEVTHFLRAYVPTLPMAPGYNNLTAATDTKSYAQALNLLLLHARSVGHAEAARRNQ
ncbi:hypothetical protein [Microbacterium sp. AK031]|uniref:hypothetical protein n=1 Tax=Microbacterium sp. AK031 TaxID=2723076 RepID=UPI00216A2B23|nr:hypothetical protein [Microbacterium sp. AK031]MCS3844809.1 hypothetical protein [Microbacterium sp. AK031]